jgi:hypothetical protein
MRYRSDELLHRVVAAHSPDDEVRLAWDVDRSRRVLHRAARGARGRRQPRRRRGWNAGGLEERFCPPAEDARPVAASG